MAEVPPPGPDPTDAAPVLSGAGRLYGQAGAGQPAVPPPLIFAGGPDPQPRRPASRLVVVDQVYHQPAQGRPQVVRLPFARDLEGHEDAYTRNFAAGADWRPLDTGWVGDAVGLLLVRNREGDAELGPYADRDREALPARVLELALRQRPDPEGQFRTMHSPSQAPPTLLRCARVRPGESCRLEPVTDDAEWLVRGTAERVRATVTAIPQ